MLILRMTSIALKLRDLLPSDTFTEAEVAGLLQGSPDQRYGVIKRALAKGDLIQLRRGVYNLGKTYQRHTPDLFEVASKVYAPSYVSLESALSYHGWIPEASYTVTSVSMKRSKSFDTPLGIFAYTHLPRFNFVGVERVKAGVALYLMATPVKALADYIVAHKIVGKKPRDVFENLRIDDEVVRQISVDELRRVAEAYGNLRLTAFVKAMQRGPR